MSSTLNELLNSGVSTNQQDMELKMQQQQQQKMNRCSRGSESNEDEDNDELDSGGGDDCDLGSSNGNSRRTSSVMPNSASCNKLSSNNHHHHLNESSGLGSSLLSPAPSSQYDHHHSPTYSDFMSSATSNGRVIRDMSNESLNEHDLGGEHEQQTSQPFDTMASINSLLLAMAATTNGGQQQQSNGAGPTSPNEFINSPQLKRPNASGSGFLGNLSSAAAAANMLFSTPIAPSSNSGNNGTSPSASGTNLASTNRLNSTPSFNTNANSMLMNLDQQSSQNRFYGRPLNAGSSMSASSSAYNLSSSTSHHNHHHHHQNQQQQQQQHHENANNSSIYDDDEVFSSFSASQQQQQQQSNNNQQQTGANNTSQQQQQEAMIAHLFRSLMMNRSQSQSQQSNNNTGNISELLMNQSLANMSLNSAANEPLNTNASANFLNMSAASNTSPTLNASNQTASNIAALLNQFKALTGSNGASASNAPNQANLAGLSPLAAAAALLKQQQKQSMNLRGGTSSLQSSPMQSSNIAALISATSNMASLLNSASTQQQPQQQQQHQQQQQQQQFDVKRRINSVATSSGFSGNASPQSSLLTHNAGPNAAVLLQNSSLASSARLNMSASSSMTASVLGSNSPLTQTLNAALQQQSQQSPNASSSHNLLSALSLSSSAGANSKPLRSERLPPHMVDEIIKQGKIRRKQGGKKEVCVFCRNNSEKEQFYTSHTLKDAQNNVACPILRLYQCPICHASGDQAHTIKYCPYAEKDSAYIKLFKDTNKMSAAASYLINSLTSAAGNGGSGSQGPNGPSANVSLNGAATPPSSAVSPPDTPSPISSQPPASFGQGPHGLNFLNSPQISSPSTASAHMSLVQALTNFQQQQQQGNANAASLNRSFGGMPSSSLLAAASFLNSTNSNLNKSN